MHAFHISVFPVTFWRKLGFKKESEIKKGEQKRYSIRCFWYERMRSRNYACSIGLYPLTLAQFLGYLGAGTGVWKG
jgi:hypothetical protein